MKVNIYLLPVILFQLAFAVPMPRADDASKFLSIDFASVIRSMTFPQRKRPTAASSLVLGDSSNRNNPDRNHPQFETFQVKSTKNIVIQLPGEVGSGGGSDESETSPFPNVDTSDGSGSIPEEGSGNAFGINFPGQSTTTNPSTVIMDNFYEEGNCSISGATVYFGGKCESILSDTACLRGYWLTINNQGVSDCSMRPCPKGELYFREKCVAVNDTSVCGPFEIMYIDYTGDVYCDCQPDYIFDQGTKRCQAEHERGSCDFGFQLEFDAEKNIKCVLNPCGREDLVINPRTKVCHVKLYSGSCSSSKLLGIQFQSDRTAVCFSVVNRNIFEVPALTSCPPGSKRSYLGKCQKVIRFGPRSPFAFSVPSQYTSRYSVCPPNYTKYPDGSCKLVNALLGR